MDNDDLKAYTRALSGILSSTYQSTNEIQDFIASKIGEIIMERRDISLIGAYDKFENGLIEKTYLIIHAAPQLITQLADAYEAVPENEWADANLLLRRIFFSEPNIDELVGELSVELPNKFPEVELSEFTESNIHCYINDIIYVVVPSIEIDTSDGRLSLARTYIDLPREVDRYVYQAFNNAGMAFDYGHAFETSTYTLPDLRLFDTGLNRFGSH